MSWEPSTPDPVRRRNRAVAFMLLLWFGLAFWYAATHFRIPLPPQ